jgi:hypothetical protein
MGELAKKNLMAKEKYTQLNINHPFEQIFKSDSYDIEQPFFQIMQEGYTIANHDRSELFSAVRKRQHMKVLLSRSVAVVAFVVIIAGGITGSGVLLKNSPFMAIAGFLSFVLAIIGAMFTSKTLAPKRVTTLFTKEGEGETLFKIIPASGHFYFNRKYLLVDNNDRTIIVFKRPYLSSIFRIKWHAETKSGKYLYTAIEDSLVMALLRRYLKLGWFIPLHFVLKKGKGMSFANFRRKYSIKDKYKLEHDPKSVPSWIIVATAILLDTGENR